MKAIGVVCVFVVVVAPAVVVAQAPPPTAFALTSDTRRTSAHAVDAPPLMDGDVLGDAAWMGVAPATGFIQTAPNEGQPASERTEVRVVFTGDTIYFGIVCYDRDPGAIIVTDSRRDSSLASSDSVQLILDTFLDRQNGFVFGTSPSGQEYDGQLINEGTGGSGMGRGGTSTGAGGGFNLNWDGVWQVRTAISDIGWSAEFAIPFRTIRFPPGRDQTWGVNFQRSIRRRNELAYWSPLPRQYDLFRVSLAGQLDRVEAPAGLWRTLQITPYAVAGALTRTEVVGGEVETFREVGGDLKYGVTSGLTLDATINTDFAQVEVDRQQINLDRFNLFFPEKRPFFLENAGAFTVSNSGGAAFNAPSQTELFFSRQIGIGAGGQAVPILGGARLSGKVTDSTTIGLLNMQTDSFGTSTPANNFGVARVRQDLPSRSSVGALFVNRQATGDLAGNDDINRTYAVDGRWGFGQNGLVSGFASKTETPALDGEDHAWDTAVDYNAQAWRLRAGYMEMGDNFNPEVGFVRRTGFRKVDGGVFYTWRPDDLLNIQEMQPHVTFNRFWNYDDGFIESSLLHMDNLWEFNDSSVLITAWNVRKEGVVDPFTISGVVVLPGAYDWNEVSLNYATDASAPFTAGFRVQSSGFFGGDLLSYGPSFGFRRGETFNVRVNWSRNDIDLPLGHVVTNLVSTQVAYNFSPRLFAQSLVQYNDSADLWSTNFRFGWLQAANTGLFLVYNESVGLGDIPHTSAGRSVILKYSYLFDVLQ